MGDPQGQAGDPQRLRVPAWGLTACAATQVAARLVAGRMASGRRRRAVAGLSAASALALPVLAGLREWQLRRLAHAMDRDVAELAERRAGELAVTKERDRRQARVEHALADPESWQMYFQPIVELRSGRTVGHEALARFGSGSPASWFTDAATVGLGVPLEVAALRKAVAAVGTLPGYISVNVTPTTLFDPRFWEVVEDVDGRQLVVELTEHVLVDEYQHYEPAFTELSRRNIRLAVDDAGAGHSTLRHIVHVAPEIIKLDRSIVEAVDIDPVRRSLVAALVGFAVAIGATLVAEGIEHQGEADALASMGVPCGQGWLYAKALPLSDAGRRPVFPPVPEVRSER